MRIVIYLGHPAQFHFFKNIISGLSKQGHRIKILLKSKDILEQLLIESGLEYTNIQARQRKNNVLSIAIASLERTFKVYQSAKKFKADLIIGSDASVAQASKLLGVPGITVLEDDYEVIKKLAKITYPFSDSIVVPSVCRVGKWENKKIGYFGYMKLAYLHPNHFVPDINVIRKYIQTEKYCLIRSAKLSAYHDTGINGLSDEIIRKAIGLMENYGYQVCISSEVPLSKEFSKYQLNIRQSDIHHIMSHASLLVSDSQSMSVEASILGVPSLRFSDFSGKISVLEELEHVYGLTYGIKTNNPQMLFDKIEEILSNEHFQTVFKEKNRKMLEDKIDVTAFFVWLISEYPVNKLLLQGNPQIQYRFR